MLNCYSLQIKIGQLFAILNNNDKKKQLISTDFNWVKWKRKFGLLVEVKEALAKVMLPEIWAFCWLRRVTM
jgi:hypothetical protein